MKAPPSSLPREPTRVDAARLPRGPCWLAVAFFSASTLLVGCRPNAEPERAASPEATDDPLVLVLSATGDELGPFTVDTPFGEQALVSLFPSVSVLESIRTSEGEPYPVARMVREGTPLLEVRSADGKRIDSVEILEGATIDGVGVRRGASWAEVFPLGSVPRCGPGAEEESGQVVCESPHSEHLMVIFGGEWDGPDGHLPPPEVLVHWRVERLIWRPRGTPSARGGS